MKIALLLIAVTAFADESKPQFTDAQKLIIAQSLAKAAMTVNAANRQIAEIQREASEKANQVAAESNAQQEKHNALVAKMLADINACEGAIVDIQQAIVCPAKK